MHIGVFAKTFPRPTLPQVLDSVIEHGLHAVQFNMQCAGLPSMPDSIDSALVKEIRLELRRHGITMQAVSGTFNLIHPDPEQREIGLQRLNVLAGVSHAMGTRLITLCTGTRDPDNMWRGNRQNASPEAWRDLVASMEAALKIADEQDVLLGVEPEVSNVVDSAQQARRLIDEMQSPRLKVIMDGANLFHQGELPRMRQILDEAFELVGKDIILAHAKDLSHDGEAGHEAAGTGMLDYPYYISLLKAVGYDGALILHGLSEEQVDASVTFLRGILDSDEA